MQCNLYGPEPGDPVFPALIDSGDSSAVRAILDSNNLKNISVRRTIGPYSAGRITMLTFDSLGLDSFTFSSDFQKLDSLWSINLSNNNLVKVTVPDSLKFRENYIGIRIERNLLTEFPIEVLKIKGLSSVDVSYNKIVSISNELINSGFRRIGIDYNKLCSVSDSVKIWLDSVQNNWANFQNCP
jgi:Leucine-rich repeat (LRR) protein